MHLTNQQLDHLVDLLETALASTPDSQDAKAKLTNAVLKAARAERSTRKYIPPTDKELIAQHERKVGVNHIPAAAALQPKIKHLSGQSLLDELGL